MIILCNSNLLQAKEQTMSDTYKGWLVIFTAVIIGRAM